MFRVCYQRGLPRLVFFKRQPLKQQAAAETLISSSPNHGTRLHMELVFKHLRYPGMFLCKLKGISRSAGQLLAPGQGRKYRNKEKNSLRRHWISHPVWILAPLPWKRRWRKIPHTGDTDSLYWCPEGWVGEKMAEEFNFKNSDEFRTLLVGGKFLRYFFWPGVAKTVLQTAFSQFDTNHNIKNIHPTRDAESLITCHLTTFQCSFMCYEVQEDFVMRLRVVWLEIEKETYVSQEQLIN